MKKITGVILAGGRAMRLQGEEKALLPFAGKPIIEHIITLLQPQVDKIIINSNKIAYSPYDRYGLTIIPDQTENYAGPLAGIASSMLAIKSDFILTVPCDCPTPPVNLAPRLLNALTSKKALIATAHDGGRIQPLFSLFNCILAQNIIHYLESGQRQVTDWMKNQETVVVDFSDQAARFININTAKELATEEEKFIATQ